MRAGKWHRECITPAVRLYAMKACKSIRTWTVKLLWLCSIPLLTLVDCAEAAEQKFSTLKIGTQTYTNVTVTTKAKSYIVLLHKMGMSSVKLADLSEEQRTQLGYALPPKPKGAPAVWAKEKLARLDTPQIRDIRSSLGAQAAVVRSNPTLLWGLAAGVVLLHLGLCYCCLRICRKAGVPSGVLVFIPLLNLFPLLKAAGMNSMWFFAFLVPMFNCIAQGVWSVKIVKALRERLWIAAFLLVPITNPFAMIYLAYSPEKRPKKQPRPVEMMTLETA